MLQVVLLGMNNPISSDPKFALWPAPVGCAGWRLWKMLADHCQVGLMEYLRLFERRNLVVGPWSAKSARLAANGILQDEELRGRSVILLGRSVCAAFYLNLIEPLECAEVTGTKFLHVPHPSGRNLWYNDPVNRESAARAIMELLPCQTA